MSSDFKDNSAELYRRVYGEVERYMRNIMEKMKGDAVRILDNTKPVPVATGELRRNIGYEIIKDALRITGVLGVSANVPYAIFVHEGARPHWPPQLPIQQWLLKKGMLKSGKAKITRGFLRGHLGKQRGIDSAKMVQQAAFLIARKISKHGTRAIPFLRLAFNQNASYAAEQFSKIKLDS